LKTHVYNLQERSHPGRSLRARCDGNSRQSGCDACLDPCYPSRDQHHRWPAVPPCLGRCEGQPGG